MNKDVQRLLNDDLTAIRQRCHSLVPRREGNPGLANWNYYRDLAELADMIETLARILATKINGDEYTRQTERLSDE